MTTPPTTGSALRLDAAALRVLAHPLRSRLLSELRRAGPATATTLAATFATNTGATSYHLRRLEAVGLVQDTGRGTGKQRLWQASTEYHSYDPSDFPDDPDSQAAVRWLQHDQLGYFNARAEAWLQDQSAWPLEWQDAAGMSDGVALVTPAQLQQLRQQMWDLLLQYRNAGAGAAEAREVAVYTFAHPVDLGTRPS